MPEKIDNLIVKYLTQRFPGIAVSTEILSTPDRIRFNVYYPPMKKDQRFSMLLDEYHERYAQLVTNQNVEAMIENTISTISLWYPY